MIGRVNYLHAPNREVKILTKSALNTKYALLSEERLITENYGMLFADDFVGASDTKDNLQRLIDLVYNFCNRWRLNANMNKSTVVVFSRNIANGDWMWGEHKLPNLTSYTYLRIDFSYNGTLDFHIKD